ncbi:MAG: NfeD family protein [Rikenellaceae bacterium]
MDMLVIVISILLGLFFCVVELLLLPGVTIGAILSVACSGYAIYTSFNHYGLIGGIIVVLIVTLLSMAAIVVSLRAKTWERLSLKSKIDSASTVTPQTKVVINSRGVTLSRLSPMGRVEIEGESYEAKSYSGYVDANTEVEVVGFDNFSVVVKRLK